MNTTQHEKLLTALRYWLAGLASADSRYYVVLEALEFFADLHSAEIRKNGARGFYHQLSILSYVRNFHVMLPNPVDVYVVILGHDSVEDYEHLSEKIRAKFPNHFDALKRISKIREGRKLTNDEYYAGLESCPVCAIAKGADRIHNMSTMSDKGAFSISKQEKYAAETREFVIPMLKTARRSFPSIEPICEAFKAMLFMQCQQTDRLVETAKRATTMLPRAAVEENRAAFEKRFGIDLYSVDNWLRENKLLVQPADATPSESN